MNAEQSKMWRPIFIVVGFTLGSFLVYFMKGIFPYEVLAGSVVMALVLMFVEWFKRKRKNNRLPEADERVIQNISRYFAYTSHVFLAILFIGLAVLTLLENETISLTYLWVFAFAYLFIASVGGFIVKRR